MKKFILILICFILFFSCSACDTEDVSSDVSNDFKIETDNESEYETNTDWEPWR